MTRSKRDCAAGNGIGVHRQTTVDDALPALGDMALLAAHAEVAVVYIVRAVAADAAAPLLAGRVLHVAANPADLTYAS